jgi:hypothetical protein
MSPILIGSDLALSGVFLMQSCESLTIYSGMFMLIVGIFLVKKGRDKA